MNDDSRKTIEPLDMVKGRWSPPLRAQLCQPSAWPFDAPGYMFLGRAIDKIGQRRFGEAWKYADTSFFWEAAAEIRRLCAAEQIAASIMQNDGRFLVIPSHAWNVPEDFQRRFASGKFCSANTDVRYSPWIFLSRADVDLLLADSGQEGPAPRGAAGYRSFCRTLVEVSPDFITMNKKSMVAVGVNRFKLSERQAIGIRTEVVRDFPAWQKAGRPRNSSR